MSKVKPKKEADKYDRNNHKFRDEWIKKALKKIKFLEVWETKTSRPNETEPVLYFRKVKCLQLAHSSKGYFTGYLFKPGSRQIVRVIDDEAQLLYELLVQRIQGIEDLHNSKPKKPKSNGVRV
jgi:hypothetical protein